MKVAWQIHDRLKSAPCIRCYLQKYVLHGAFQLAKGLHPGADGPRRLGAGGAPLLHYSTKYLDRVAFGLRRKYLQIERKLLSNKLD